MKLCICLFVDHDEVLVQLYQKKAKHNALVATTTFSTYSLLTQKTSLREILCASLPYRPESIKKWNVCVRGAQKKVVRIFLQNHLCIEYLSATREQELVCKGMLSEIV